MAKKQISRLYDFQPNTTIKSQEVDDEFNQLVDSINEIYDAGDYRNGQYFVLASRIVEPTWIVQNLKNFLEVAHNPDGTIKSTGIGDPLLQAHNDDVNAHQVLMDAHNNDLNAHSVLMNAHDTNPDAHYGFNPL